MRKHRRSYHDGIDTTALARHRRVAGPALTAALALFAAACGSDSSISVYIPVTRTAAVSSTPTNPPPTATHTLARTATATPRETATNPPLATATRTITTQAATRTATATIAASATATSPRTPTATFTLVPPSPSATATVTSPPTPSATHTRPPTATNTLAPTATNTAPPTATATRTSAATATQTSAASPTATRIATGIPTGTATATATRTATGIPTGTAAATATATTISTATRTAVATSTNTPPPTATFTATSLPSATFTPTATPTGGSGAVCGNRVLEAGETCESCAPDCVIGPCNAPGAPTQAYIVDLVQPSGFQPTTATVLLAYDSTKLSLPGTGTATTVRQRIVAPAPVPQAFTPNDKDYGVQVLISRNIALGQLFTATFDRCAGSAAPDLTDVACTVLSCAQGGGSVAGCTCTVRLP